MKELYKVGQVLNKEIDDFGVHLIVKNKESGYLHIEGHDLSLQHEGNKALLRRVPSYFFPVDQTYIDKALEPK